VGRLNQRQGFLVSAIAHLAILMALATHPPSPPTPMPTEPVRDLPPEPPRAALRAPDRELLRQLLDSQARPPQAVPTPPPAPLQKDRISIGAPSEARQERLILRRDEDLVTPKGIPSAAPATAPSPGSADAGSPALAATPATPLSRPRPETANGRGTAARTPPGPSIAGSLRNLDQRLQKTGPQGLATGTGQQMGALFFDPEGADFTSWMNHFKNEVYRNWIVPQPALLGFRGHVDIEFVVERDGKISALRVLKSTGTPALDRAAQNALLGSRFLALPADFGPARITMQGSMYYNERPQG
jgi:periplasmic protein TonB